MHISKVFRSTNDAQPYIPADSLRLPPNFNVWFQNGSLASHPALGDGMSDTVIFWFEAISATLHTGFSKELSNTPFITYRLKNEHRQKVLTPAGVDLTEDAEWSIQVYGIDKYNDHVDKDGGIGFMRRSRPGEFYISAAVGVSAFDRLARSSFLPEKVTVHARGLTYGKDYEGADKVWSEPEKGAVVTEIAFSLPLTAPQEPDAPAVGCTTKQGFELARRATTLLYVIAIALALIGFRLYFH